MLKIPINNICSSIVNLFTSFASAVIFYTVVPLPVKWTNNWMRIARWCPIVGLFIGASLALISASLKLVEIPNFTRNTLTVAAWIYVTGGLHLDGAMDTADGLSVTNPDRRLDVMKDSATGAFGAMAAIVILVLKVVTLSEMSLPLWLVLLSATGWARWGQVLAIAFYPYLRETGKGSFHRENLRSPQDILLGLIVLLGLSGAFAVGYLSWWQAIVITLGNMAIALLTGYWFNRQLGGHTGDTYGAVVEWSEALILCFLTAF